MFCLATSFDRILFAGFMQILCLVSAISGIVGAAVTDIENIGTYNYFPVSEKINNLFDIVNAVLHMVVDVIPYYEWGNGPYDSTPFPERVAGPESGGKITSQIRNLFLTEDSIEKEQKEIDEFFQKYKKIIKD